jgi:hypothetical protein
MQRPVFNKKTQEEDESFRRQIFLLSLKLDESQTRALGEIMHSHEAQVGYFKKAIHDLFDERHELTSDMEKARKDMYVIKRDRDEQWRKLHLANCDLNRIVENLILENMAHEAELKVYKSLVSIYKKQGEYSDMELYMLRTRVAAFDDSSMIQELQTVMDGRGNDLYAPPLPMTCGALFEPDEGGEWGLIELYDLPTDVSTIDTHSMVQELRAAMKVTPKPVTCAALFEPVVTPLPRAMNTSLELHDALKNRRRMFEDVPSDSDQD